MLSRLDSLPLSHESRASSKFEGARDEMVQGLVASESLHVSKLQHLVTTVVQPLRVLAGTEREIVSIEDMETLFASLEEVVAINEDFLRQLRLSRDVLDLFVEFGQAMDPYVRYLQSFGTTITTLLMDYEELPAFRAFMRGVQLDERTITCMGRPAKTDALRVLDIMKLPVHRISVYCSLLTDLTAHQQMHSGHSGVGSMDAKFLSLKNATQALQLDMSVELLMHVQTYQIAALRESNNTVEVGLLLRKMPVKPEFVDACRSILVNNEELYKICRKGHKPYRLILFSNVLLTVTDHAGEYRLHHEIILSDPATSFESSKQSHLGSKGFLVRSAQKSFVVLAKSESQARAWLRDLQKTKEVAIQAVSGLVVAPDTAVHEQGAGIPASNDEPLMAAPVWVADHDCHECMLCKNEFTVTRRRHHCRLCGCVVCGPCSKHREEITMGSTRRRERVCDRCVVEKQRYGTYTEAATAAQMRKESDAPASTKVRSRMVGYLTKRSADIAKDGAIKWSQWKRRWFVLSGPTVSYYIKPNDQNAKGSFDVRDYEIESNPSSFEITFHSKTRKFSLKVADDNAGAYMEWDSVLCEAIALEDAPLRVGSADVGSRLQGMQKAQPNAAPSQFHIFETLDTIEVTFSKHEPLGFVFEEALSLEHHRKYFKISAIRPGSQAAASQSYRDPSGKMVNYGRIKPGIILSQIEGTTVSGLQYDDIVARLKSRPVTLMFYDGHTHSHETEKAEKELRGTAAGMWSALGDSGGDRDKNVVSLVSARSRKNAAHTHAQMPLIEDDDSDDDDSDNDDDSDDDGTPANDARKSQNGSAESASHSTATPSGASSVRNSSVGSAEATAAAAQVLYYVSSTGNKEGPVVVSRFVNLIRDPCSNIDLNVLVWTKGMDGWKSLRHVLIHFPHVMNFMKQLESNTNSYRGGPLFGVEMARLQMGEANEDGERIPLGLELLRSWASTSGDGLGTRNVCASGLSKDPELYRSIRAQLEGEEALTATMRSDPGTCMRLILDWYTEYPGGVLRDVDRKALNACSTEEAALALLSTMPDDMQQVITWLIDLAVEVARYEEKNATSFEQMACLVASVLKPCKNEETQQTLAFYWMEFWETNS